MDIEGIARIMGKIKWKIWLDDDELVNLFPKSLVDGQYKEQVFDLLICGLSQVLIHMET